MAVRLKFLKHLSSDFITPFILKHIKDKNMVSTLRKILFAACAFMYVFPASHFLAAQDKEEDDSVSLNLIMYRKNFVNSYIIPSLITGEAKAKKIKDENTEFWIQSNGKWESFDMSANASSKTIQYRGPASFKIYQKVPGSDESKPQYKPVSRITVPKGASELAILMFVRKTSVKFYPVDLSPQKIPKGRLVVMNMTSVPVALSLDGQSKFMRSMSHIIFPFKEKDQALPILVAIRRNEKWQVMFRSRISPNKEQRNLVLLYDPFERKNTNINVQILNF